LRQGRRQRQPDQDAQTANVRPRPIQPAPQASPAGMNRAETIPKYGAEPGKWPGTFSAIWRDVSRSAWCSVVTAPAGSADLGVGDLVGEQGVDLGGLGGGVAEAAAHDLDGDAAVDQLAGVRVAELVDADPGAGGGAVLLPPAVRRVVGQRAAAAVDAGTEQRARGVPGSGQEEPEQHDIAPVVDQERADRAALDVDAGVLVVRAQVQVLDVHPADLRGAGTADV